MQVRIINQIPASAGRKKLGGKTMTDSEWESGTIGGMFSNEKYKGDFHLQKYDTPPTQRNATRRNKKGTLVRTAQRNFRTAIR